MYSVHCSLPQWLWTHACRSGTRPEHWHALAEAAAEDARQEASGSAQGVASGVMTGQEGAKQRIGARAAGDTGLRVAVREAQHKWRDGRQPRDAVALAQPTGAMLGQPHVSLEHCLYEVSPTSDQHAS